MSGNSEKLTGYLPNEESVYKEEVKSSLERVFGYHLSREADTKKLDGEEREAYFQRRLPVFFDAFKRGLPVFEKKLETTPFVLENSIAKKKYFLEYGQLRWQIVPKTDDPFDQIPFLKAYREESTKGEAEILTEPVLIEQALLEGFRQQNLLYEGFSNTLVKVARVRTVAAATLQYIHSQEAPFAEIDRVYRQLKRLKTPQGELSEVFIENFVLGNDPVLEKCPDIERLCDHILDFNLLLTKAEGGVSKDARRKLLENTLAIELVANPRSFADPEKFTEATTTVESLFKVNKLINLARAGATPEEFLVRISLLVYKILEEAGSYLDHFFEQNNIPRPLGIEFFTNLLYQKLKDLPGKELEEFNDDSPDRLWEQWRISQYYNLSEENLVISAQGAKQEQEEKVRKEVKGEIYPSELEESEFVNGFLNLGKFPLWVLETWAPQAQQAVIRRILCHQALSKEDTCLNKINEILNKLGVTYSSSDKKFVRGKPKLRTDISDAAAFSPSRHLLEVLSDEIKQGNKILSASLETIIVNSLIREFIEEKLHMRKESRKFRADISFSSLISDYRDREEAGEDELKNLLDYVCAAALSSYTPVGIGELNARINFFKTIFSGNVEGLIGNIPLLSKNKIKRAEARFKKLSAELRKFDFQTRSRRLLEEIKQDHFGEYYQKEENFLIKVLEDSVVIFSQAVNASR